MEWTYSTKNAKSSGYEDVLDLLIELSKEYQSTEDEGLRSSIVDRVFNIYRGRNIFPITYYNEKGIESEIKKCYDKDIKWEGNVLNLKNNQGGSLLRFLFPNQMSVTRNYTDPVSMEFKFNNDSKLRRAVVFALKYDKANPIGVLRGLRMIGGQTDTNFSTMKAQAIYERFCPKKNGVIYDYSSGYGGRMLGALTSKNNYKYIGVEPNIETYQNLLMLGKYVEKTLNREDSFEIHNTVSENFKMEEESIDFAFSSPPYFNLEQYTNEETQSYIKYNTLDKWYEGYVNPTLLNIYHMLKEDSMYAVNIADFGNGKNGRVEIVDRWVAQSEKVGFELVEQVYMKSETRKNNNFKTKDGYIEIKEGVFIFKK
jgi:hypothetical protein